MTSESPQRADFRFWTEEKLRNADTDQFRHVNNAVISTFLEAGRMEIFAPAEVRALMDGANLAVVKLLIEFRIEVHFPGRASIGTNVMAVGTTSFRVRQALFMNDDVACSASAEATCVLVNPQTGRPHPIGPELRKYLLANAKKEVAS
jgi:acyl-CoA thioester hydrolase